MTSAKNHAYRSSRSNQSTKEMLGTLHARRRISHSSKQVSQSKFKAILTPMITKMKNLAQRLSDRFTTARKQAK